MDKFKLVSPYKPTGDQPEAIDNLVKGLQNGNRMQTLLGVTGSGKTFTMANVIEKFESVNAFIDELNEYIYYYNNERISSKLKMSPVQYRTHFHII